MENSQKQIEEIESCNYECTGGYLKNHIAWQQLKEHLLQNNKRYRNQEEDYEESPYDKRMTEAQNELDRRISLTPNITESGRRKKLLKVSTIYDVSPEHLKS